jgi:hypothetical protein
MEIYREETVTKKLGRVRGLMNPELEESTEQRKRGKTGKYGITIRLTEEQWKAVNAEAAARGVHMTDVFMDAVSDKFEAKGMPRLR